MKEYKIYDIPNKLSIATLYAAFAWLVFGLMLLYGEEFKDMVVGPKGYGVSQKEYDSESEIWTSIIPVIVFLLALYFSKKAYDYKPRQPELIMKISEEGFWHQEYGLLKWEDFWYISSFYEEATARNFLILKMVNEQEIKIEADGLATGSHALKHYILETTTNPKIKDAGHLIDDTTYDRYGNVTN